MVFLDKKADELESRLRKIKGNSKNFEEAIQIYKELLVIYNKLNYKFLAEKAEEEIIRYENHIKQEKLTQDLLKKARNGSIQKTEEKKPINYPALQKGFQQSNLKSTLQPSVKKKTINNKLINSYRKKEQEGNIFKPDNNKSRLKTIDKLRKKKEIEEKCINNANSLMDKAQFHMKRKEYDYAAQYYEQSSEIFEKIGWIQQANVLKQEIQNMKVMQKENLKKLEEIKARQRKEQALYDLRVSKILAEKEEKKRKKIKEENKLPLEIQRKYDRAKLFLEKTEILESKGKIEKALSRYKYLLELYNEIDFDEDQKNKIREKIKKME